MRKEKVFFQSFLISLAVFVVTAGLFHLWEIGDIVSDS